MIVKTGIFFLLISFLQVVTSFPAELGEKFKCKSQNGKFPKPGSFCRSYYLCSNWSPKEKDCPQDQHFFPAKGYCVFAEDYPCLEKPKSKECPLPDGKFLKPGTECKVYYDCCKGQPTEKKCAKGTLFDHSRGKCDWPKYVTCPEDVSTTKSSSQSTSTLSISSTPVSISTRKVITSTKSPKIATTDSDEDSSSTESGSSEEGNSSEENRQSSTKSEIMSTIISSTTNDEYTVSTEGEVTKSRTESLSTVENSSRGATSTSAPDESSATSEISTASFTDEYVLKTTTYPKVVTGGTSTSIITEMTQPEITTEETHTEFVTKETRPEIVTSTRVVTKETHTEIVTSTGVVTKETHPEMITEETRSESTYTVENKDDYSTTITPGLTEPVTTHIFCPKPNGYFPHPYDKHKFIACIEGNPTIMNCPEDLVYDHKKRSCEYNTKKRKFSEAAKYM